MQGDHERAHWRPTGQQLNMVRLRLWYVAVVKVKNATRQHFGTDRAGQEQPVPALPGGCHLANDIHPASLNFSCCCTPSQIQRKIYDRIPCCNRSQTGAEQ
jgi:hypothetical protein